MLYIIDPSLSQVDRASAEQLLDAAIREWDDVPTSRVQPAALLGCAPSSDDAVVFFTPVCPEHADDVDSVLELAREHGAIVVPVALTPAGRRPPVAAGDRQSFDVTDQLRRRELTDDQISVVGAALAREILSLMLPTFVPSRLRLFLCHRRSDGEQLTALIDQHLSARHEHVFRDLIDIQAGDAAQSAIDQALAGADVVVFLDTPAASESWWIEHELASALGRAIPIVWVQLGSPGDRMPLHIRPAATPHLAAGLDATRKEVGEIADKILLTATRLALQHVRTSRKSLGELRRWARDHNAAVEVLDARRQVFLVRQPAGTDRRPYPIRPATDVVQFFGHTPTDADRDALGQLLTTAGLGPHHRECRAFDAAIMLDPTATAHRAVGEWSVLEHPSAYLDVLAGSRPSASEVNRTLLLLGAFPTGDLAQDEITPALQAAALTWLRLGGSIVCGGHPTFVPLLTEAARAVAGDQAPDRLTIFWSSYYAAPAQVTTLKGKARVIQTPGGETRAESLTQMRRQMIAEGGATDVLAIGGRTEEGGTHQPGIDEEIRLARMAELPVYLFGAPGGRAAAIAAAESARGWTGLGNHLDEAANEDLRTTGGYEDAMRSIWATRG